MILSLDNLAHRYHCLPSEALARASTFDLYVLDISARWANHQSDPDKPTTPKAPKLTQQQMLDMIKAVKERKK